MRSDLYKLLSRSVRIYNFRSMAPSSNSMCIHPCILYDNPLYSMYSFMYHLWHSIQYIHLFSMAPISFLRAIYIYSLWHSVQHVPYGTLFYDMYPSILYVNLFGYLVKKSFHVDRTLQISMLRISIRCCSLPYSMYQSIFYGNLPFLHINLFSMSPFSIISIHLFSMSISIS